MLSLKSNLISERSLGMDSSWARKIWLNWTHLMSVAARRFTPWTNSFRIRFFHFWICVYDSNILGIESWMPGLIKNDKWNFIHKITFYWISKKNEEVKLLPYVGMNNKKMHVIRGKWKKWLPFTRMPYATFPISILFRVPTTTFTWRKKFHNKTFVIYAVL